ncbi:MAG TPA: transcription termination/antitermination protein NusA [Christensenellaceae bacterium]|nr:transcription termination/antitermination protein NusA [Christensenellaceae bacterium]
MKGKKIDIIDAISALAREKDIDEAILINTIEDALKAAYRRNNQVQSTQNLTVRLTRKEGVQVFARKVVVEEVEDPETQITLQEAHAIRSDYHLDDIVEIDVTPDDFGRVAAQTAKQMLVQRIREAERGKIYEEYIEKEQEILTAIVQRVEPKAVFVELGRTEGIMESSEFMPGEVYREGDHIKVYVLKVHGARLDGSRNPQVYVSRVHPGLVKRLFEMEVPEIAKGIVQIRSLAREAGSRTKIAVYSTDPLIDPVGACVGPRGMRVEKVVNELKNEKIDIIKWSPDPAEFVANALNPAHVMSVFISEEEKICRVVVPDQQLSLAIGKEGQNTRLAAKLTSWKIDIKSETQIQELFEEQGIDPGMVFDDEPQDWEDYTEQEYYDDSAEFADFSGGMEGDF